MSTKHMPRTKGELNSDLIGTPHEPHLVWFIQCQDTLIRFNPKNGRYEPTKSTIKSVVSEYVTNGVHPNITLFDPTTRKEFTEPQLITLYGMLHSGAYRLVTLENKVGIDHEGVLNLPKLWTVMDAKTYWSKHALVKEEYDFLLPHIQKWADSFIGMNEIYKLLPKMNSNISHPMVFISGTARAGKDLLAKSIFLPNEPVPLDSLDSEECKKNSFLHETPNVVFTESFVSGTDFKSIGHKIKQWVSNNRHRVNLKYVPSYTTTSNINVFCTVNELDQLVHIYHACKDNSETINALNGRIYIVNVMTQNEAIFKDHIKQMTEYLTGREGETYSFEMLPQYIHYWLLSLKEEGLTQKLIGNFKQVCEQVKNTQKYENKLNHIQRDVLEQLIEPPEGFGSGYDHMTSKGVDVIVIKKSTYINATTTRNLFKSDVTKAWNYIKSVAAETRSNGKTTFRIPLEWAVEELEKMKQ